MYTADDEVEMMKASLFMKVDLVVILMKYITKAVL